MISLRLILTGLSKKSLRPVQIKVMSPGLNPFDKALPGL
jgi:hypothetical protein